MKVVEVLVGELRRRILGISAEEIRYTFEDVRAEIRAVRAELKQDIDAIRKDIDSLPSRQDSRRGWRSRSPRREPGGERRAPRAALVGRPPSLERRLLHDHAPHRRGRPPRRWRRTSSARGAGSPARGALRRLRRARHDPDLLARRGELVRARLRGSELHEAALEMAAGGRAEHDLLADVAALRERSLAA